MEMQAASAIASIPFLMLGCAASSSTIAMSMLALPADQGLPLPMARIFPFRALRYNPSLVRVEDCVTQPYDKITPSMQEGYYARSPYNLVRIILGLPELFDSPGVNDVYTRAARDFHDWREAGVLAREPEPCLFAYSQRFTPPGSPLNNSQVEVERRGLIALGAVSPYSEGIVFRHEQTHTKARTDRMNLLRSTRAHFGQIFMLYSDPAKTVESLIFPSEGDQAIPEIEVRDESGVLHRVWKISDPAIINMVQGALGDKKLIIADGHHRYETALAYAAEKSGEKLAENLTGKASLKGRLGSTQEPVCPEAAVMMTLVNMDGEGLAILPTHRVVHGLASFDDAAFQADAAVLFSRVEPLALNPRNTEALLEALAHATAQAGPDTTVMLGVSARQVLVLTMDRTARDHALAQLSERQRQLDMVVLHQGVLTDLLGISADAVRAGEHVTYAREAADALAPVLRGDAQIAFLVNPVTLAQLRENTFAGEVMPQKSTDFYPKLLSGLTIYALDEKAEAEEAAAARKGVR